MYGLLSKLLISKKLKFEEGEIILFDEPVAFVPMVSFVQMTRDAMKKGYRAINDLYFYGWVYGFIVTLGMIKKFKLKKFEERYKVSMDIASLGGFGDYKTIEFWHGGSHFRVLKNPFALEFYPSKELVDHYLRGMNAGGGTLVQEESIQCLEFECAAKNGQYCEFRNLNMAGLKKIDPKIVESQLDLDYLRKRQKALVEECKMDPAKLGL